ncbi:MAG: hypothetical protein AAFX79_07915 [Planctomycetota bacterium]
MAQPDTETRQETPTPRTGAALWAVRPPLAVSRELGVGIGQARGLVRVVRRRHPAAIAMVIAVQIAATLGWMLLVTSITRVYETTTTFHPDGSVQSEETLGPFGVTVAPMVIGLAFGPGLALVLGAAAGFTVDFLLIGRETRRCVRRPACFGCGYDLAAITAGVCPECGDARPAAHADAGRPRTVEP